MRFFNRSSDLESAALRTNGSDPSREKLAAIAASAATPRNSEDPSSKASRSSQDVSAEILKEFMEKYDPHPINLPNIFPMSEHRAMVRTMFLDNILYNTAKLHKHNWILLSQNEKYRACSSSNSLSCNRSLTRGSMYTRSLGSNCSRPRPVQCAFLSSPRRQDD
jgi:hypothetical protein